MMVENKDLGIEATAFVTECDEFLKESMKMALDAVELADIKLDDEQMTYFKLLMNSITLLQKAEQLTILEATKIQHIENLLEDLVLKGERLGDKLADIDHEQRQLDTRFDGLEEAIRTSGKLKADK